MAHDQNDLMSILCNKMQIGLKKNCGSFLCIIISFTQHIQPKNADLQITLTLLLEEK